MLTDDQREQIRERLLAERRRILSKAKEAAAFSRDRDRNRIGGDSIDESAEEVLYGTELRLADRDSRTLKGIERSIQRLDAGELDECSDCGDDIAFPRLRARPMTTLCVACQEDAENEGRL